MKRWLAMALFVYMFESRFYEFYWSSWLVCAFVLAF